MMKNIISSPYRKMKILLILPVIAIVLYAFAKPDYKYKIIDQMSGDPLSAAYQVQHEVTGTVVQKDGNPLSGAIITLKNTTIGTITDASGSFKFVNVPDDGVLYISYAGFKSKAIKPDFKAPMTIEMVKETAKSTDINISAPSPPPPPPPTMDIRNIDNPDAPPPLYIVDGAIASPADVKKIDPELIGSINVIKDKGNNSRATSKYGDQGKNGVVEITTKKKMAESGDMIAPPPPPPPPQSVLDIKSADGKAILYIIDGVKYKDDINKIPTESIESITVLKDGSATSVYGEEGKSGVILITTKKDGKHPLVVVDGIIKDIDVNRIDPATIESLSVPGKYAAARKYGDKAKDGVVEIKLKKPAEKIQDTKE